MRWDGSPVSFWAQTPLTGTICMPPLGTTYDIGSALTAGGGVIDTVDPTVVEYLRSVPSLLEVSAANLVTNGSVETDLSGWTLTTVPLPVNLVPNGGFEYDTVGGAPAGWVNSGSTNFSVVAQTFTGSQGAHALNLGLNTALAWTIEQTVGQAVVVGTSYTARMSLKQLASNSTGVRIGINWYDGSATLISTTWGTYTGNLGNGVAGTATVAGSAPAGAVTAKTTIGKAVVDIWNGYVDAIALRPTAQGTTYIDGDTSGYSWAGTAGNSTTTQATATMTQSSAWAAAGTKSVRFTATATTDILASPSFAVTAGTTKMVQAFYNATTISTGNIGLTVHWSDGTSTTLATVTSTGTGTASAGLVVPAGVTSGTIRAAPSTAGTFDIMLDNLIVR